MSYSYANYYNYARLGSSCQVNRDVLTSNTKFFPVGDPIYNLVYTAMHRYPGPDYRERNKQREEREGIDNVQTKKENNKGCCGN